MPPYFANIIVLYTINDVNYFTSYYYYVNTVCASAGTLIRWSHAFGKSVSYLIPAGVNLDAESIKLILLRYLIS